MLAEFQHDYNTAPYAITAADWAVCDEVKAHWKSIIDGKVPFGYTVRD